MRNLSVGLLCFILIGCSTSFNDKKSKHLSFSNPEYPCKTFNTEGVQEITLRASQIYSSKVIKWSEGQYFKICGEAFGINRFHPQLDLIKIPGANLGLGFVGKKYRDKLVVSTNNEIRAIHHSHILRNITIETPRGVKLTRELKTLYMRKAGSNLSPPK